MDLKLLLIDDEPDLLEILEVIIQANFNVDTVLYANGDEAIKKLQEDDSIGAIFCDLTMPIKSGADVFLFNKEHNNLPFTMLTGDAFDEHEVYEDFTKAHPANFFIQKPYFEDDIVDAINRIKNWKEDTTNKELSKETERPYRRISIDSLKKNDLSK